MTSRPHIQALGLRQLALPAVGESLGFVQSFVGIDFDFHEQASFLVGLHFRQPLKELALRDFPAKHQ